jgi:hypothetical protein
MEFGVVARGGSLQEPFAALLDPVKKVGAGAGNPLAAGRPYLRMGGPRSEFADGVLISPHLAKIVLVLFLVPRSRAGAPRENEREERER